MVIHCNRVILKHQDAIFLEQTACQERIWTQKTQRPLSAIIRKTIYKGKCNTVKLGQGRQ